MLSCVDFRRDFSDPFECREHFAYPLFNDEIDPYWVTLIPIVASRFAAREFHAPDRFAVHFLICEDRI